MTRNGRDDGGGFQNRPRMNEGEGSYGGGKSYHAGGTKLDWQPIDPPIVHENVTATICRAEGDRGDVLYSFSVGRRNPKGQTSKFLQPRDIDALRQIISKVEEFIEADRVGADRDV